MSPSDFYCPPHVFFLLHSICTDAGVLEHRRPHGKDTLLGSRHGWLAPPSGYSSAEVVSPGHRAGSDEWVWSGHAHPQHAHHHVLLLPQQVTHPTHSLAFFVAVFFLFIFCYYDVTSVHSGTKITPSSVLYPKSSGWSVTTRVCRTSSRLLPCTSASLIGWITRPDVFDVDDQSLFFFCVAYSCCWPLTPSW